MPIAVLISGHGSNLQALIDSCQNEDFPARIVKVFSNVPGVEGIKRAARSGIPSVVLDHKTFDSREAFDEAMIKRIDESGAELVCLAGFMRRLGNKFVQHYHNRLINIHPSLLPAFPGLNIHEQVIESGTKLSGCTVHFVREELDNGPIIIQAALPVNQNDTPKLLASRVLELEHGAYSQAVKWFAEGRITVEDNQVIISESETPNSILVNPDPRF